MVTYAKIKQILHAIFVQKSNAKCIQYSLRVYISISFRLIFLSCYLMNHEIDFLKIKTKLALIIVINGTTSTN